MTCFLFVNVCGLFVSVFVCRYKENMHELSVIAPGYLSQGSTCFVELNNVHTSFSFFVFLRPCSYLVFVCLSVCLQGLFYLGFPAGGDCYLPYPFSGQFLRSFRSVPSTANNTLTAYYFLSQSTLDERPPHAFAVHWIAVLVVYLLLFLLFLVVVLPVMLCCFCCTRCQAANTDAASSGTELKLSLVGASGADSSPVASPTVSEYSPVGVTVFALGAHAMASLLYVAALISTLLLLQKQIYIGYYAPVIATMSTNAAAVAFAALAVVGTVTIKVMTRIRWPLFGLYVCFSFFVVV